MPKSILKKSIKKGNRYGKLAVKKRSMKKIYFSLPKGHKDKKSYLKYD